MNYLGHLFFSNNDLPLMLANLYGDFVKGQKYKQLPPVISEGVLLHRAIDHFTDQHQSVKELRLLLYPELPKVAGIAIDLYFDHLLAKNWKSFHHKPLGEFVALFFQYANHILTDPSKIDAHFRFDPSFHYLIHKMYAGNWINNYTHLHGLHFAAKGLSSRLSFKNELYRAADVYQRYEQLIQGTFFIFMEDALSNFKVAAPK